MNPRAVRLHSSKTASVTAFAAAVAVLIRHPGGGHAGPPETLRDNLFGARPVQPGP
jgi:hypothetical protein